ncbi:MAG: hypothetical protein WAU07_05010, partial [Microgenomates group bacterium]
NVGIRARWGNPISHSDAKRASEILQHKGFDFVSGTHPETINLIVNYCLNEAKDELLASMNTPGRTVKAKYAMIIDPKDDTYDYLQQHLGFKPNDTAYIRVRKEYIAQLDAHTKELRDFEEAYQSETWRKRKIIMANSLAPEPIQEFPKFFSECGFETEIYHIRATTAELNEMLHSLHKIRWIKRSFRSVSTFKDAQLWNAKVVTILDRRLNRLLKHRSNHSMIIPITRIAADVAKLKIRILESREYRILSELSVLRNTHNRLARNVELLRQGMRFDLSPFDEVEGFFEFQLNLLVQTIENMSDFAKIEDQIQDLQESIRFTYKDYQAILDMYTKEVQVLIDEIYSSVERHKKYFRMHKRTQSSSQDESSTSYQLFKKHEGELNQILDDFERRNNGKAIINLRPEFERLVEQLRSLQTSLNNAELR